MIKGDTIIYGHCIRNKYGLRLVLDSGFGIPLTLGSIAENTVINKLVGLKGEATWNKHHNIISFSAESDLGYQPFSTRDAIAELREIAGKYWDKFNTTEEINEALGRD